MTETSAGKLIWGAPTWLLPMAATCAVFGLVILWAYWQISSRSGVRVAAALLKVTGILAIALCVVEPLFTAVRPRPGANLFLVLADNSESLTVHDAAAGPPRANQLRAALKDDSPWLARLGQDFELRRYLFDSRLRATDSFQALSFDGTTSTLAASLSSIARQYQGRPVAGVLLLTDGNATDWNEASIDWSALPPIYPVLVGEEELPCDVSVGRISVSQTNFETIPITVQAEVTTSGLSGEELTLQLCDDSNKEVQRQTVIAPADDKPLVHRFQFRPEKPGVTFYSVKAVPTKDEAELNQSKPGREATIANNVRLAMVDRGHGPYRVLYVTGRPNWELKFLRRSAAEDEEVHLVALVRIAKKEPRFSFRGHLGETTNPLFRGFGNQADQAAEQYDEPVLVRLGTKDRVELRDGFPKTADQLFQFHALILDDIEAEFFTRDQISLMQQFVSQRGGGLLMLGGQESFSSGGYARTPLGDLLPIYMDRSKTALPPGEYGLSIAREGWLQPWVRLRATEQEEQKRLEAMPGFRIWNAAASIKPGATVLIHAQQMGANQAKSNSAKTHPALVVQRFGAGQTSALLVGDLWRWGMRRESPAESDLGKAWRQTIRWLVSDVPQPVEMQVERDPQRPNETFAIRVLVRDENYQPLDNADVVCKVHTPEGKQLEFKAAASDDKPGEYLAELVPRAPGAYRITTTAAGPDGQEIGKCESGAVHEPATEEFRQLRPNRELMQRIAQRTGGEIVNIDRLDGFAANLPNRKIPITEPWVYPLWHQWPVLGLALACLIGEWGVRRWKGLP
jgi:hypothetical protein